LDLLQRLRNVKDNVLAGIVGIDVSRLRVVVLGLRLRLDLRLRLRLRNVLRLQLLVVTKSR
jgi:hypothetical protein